MISLSNASLKLTIHERLLCDLVWGVRIRVYRLLVLWCIDEVRSITKKEKIKMERASKAAVWVILEKAKVYHCVCVQVK